MGSRCGGGNSLNTSHQNTQSQKSQNSERNTKNTEKYSINLSDKFTITPDFASTILYIMYLNSSQNKKEFGTE